MLNRLLILVLIKVIPKQVRLLLQIPVCTTFHHRHAAYFRYTIYVYCLVAGGACMVLRL